MLALLIGVSAGLGYYFAVGRYTNVPGVLALTEQAATEKLTDAGLKVQVGDPVFSNNVDKGLVAQQDPGIGDRISKDGTVTLHMSKGIEEYAVPSFKGKTYDEAKALLEQNHLALGVVTRKNDDKVAKDEVVSSLPKAGEKLRPGAKVALVVSDGPAEVTVPNVVGKNVNDATSLLTAAGLKVTARPVFSDTVPKDSVVAQDPKQGTKAHRTDTVTLDVSKGPQLFEVPNVVGKNPNEASAILRGAGFNPEVSRPFGFGNTVRAQNPTAGSQEPKGTTIRLIVY